jgi:hypothetical protein
VKWTVNRDGTVVAETADDELSVTGGYELGDWLSFVSGGRDSTAATVETHESQRSTDLVELNHAVELQSGQASAKQVEQAACGSLRRRLHVSGNPSVLFGDAVIRFVVEPSDGVARIGGRRYRHRGLNRYLQFPTDKARIEAMTGTFEVELERATVPGGVIPVLYVRDDPSGVWVIHVRAITVGGEHGILRLYRGPWRRVRLFDTVVSSRPRLASALSYLRERSSVPGRYLPLQYVHRVLLAKGSKVVLEATARVLD